MCHFDIFHIIPLVLIALLGSLSFLFPSVRKYLAPLTLLLSSIGLIAGNHVHVDHLQPLSLLDPCVAYGVAMLVSSVALARRALIKLKVSFK